LNSARRCRDLIPTGELKSVHEPPSGFSQPTAIGEINADNECLHLGKGCDHKLGARQSGQRDVGSLARIKDGKTSHATNEWREVQSSPGTPDGDISMARQAERLMPRRARGMGLVDGLRSRTSDNSLRRRVHQRLRVDMWRLRSISGNNRANYIVRGAGGNFCLDFKSDRYFRANETQQV
jgi:hypothetical protein